MRTRRSLLIVGEAVHRIFSDRSDQTAGEDAAPFDGMTRALDEATNVEALDAERKGRRDAALERMESGETEAP